MKVLACSISQLVPAVLVVLANSGVGNTAVAQGATNPGTLVDAVRRKGCTEDGHYRATGGVLCPEADAASGGADPDAVLQALGVSIKDSIQALTLQTRKEDAACAQGAVTTAAGGTTVGPSTAELAQALVRSAVEDAKNFTLPTGLMLSIPGVTQVQYEYKGLSNGPEIRTFKISGRVDGDVDQAKLRLQIDGDVEGDRNLYVEYTVNYQKTKTPFPAWSPFLDTPGDITQTFVRQGLDMLSATADFSEKGEHRNGVQVWHEYEYAWHAEKVGALPKDVVKQSDGAVTDLAKYPYGGDWVGTGWGAETRFQRTRKQFVAQFSPALAGTMTPEEESAGVVMSLNVKHKAAFYFHVDFDGNVSGRGTIIYTLDPNLCGVAVLTRQVNEQVNFMKYLPIIYLAARQLGELAVRRFYSASMTEPGTITEKVDEYLRTLPPKIDPAEGARRVLEFMVEHTEVEGGRNVAYFETNVPGVVDNEVWWRPSGEGTYADPQIVPAPARDAPRVFRPDKWFRSSGQTGLNFDSETVLMEALAKRVPPGATGTVRIYSRFLTCDWCEFVIYEAEMYFKNIKFVVTSKGNLP